MINSIFEECHETFVTCYHAFYPTAYLKWTSLCELLSEVDEVNFLCEKVDFAFFERLS